VNRLPNSPLVARALQVAEKHLGAQQLAQRLDIPETMIEAWRLGHAPIPEGKFLQLVDIITELDIAWSEWNPAD
jgi:hypothetical protein